MRNFELAVDSEPGCRLAHVDVSRIVSVGWPVFVVKQALPGEIMQINSLCVHKTSLNLTPASIIIYYA